MSWMNIAFFTITLKPFFHSVQCFMVEAFSYNPSDAGRHFFPAIFEDNANNEIKPCLFSMDN